MKDNLKELETNKTFATDMPYETITVWSMVYHLTDSSKWATQRTVRMVVAELTHNPYLVETIVRFNGAEPKVNSPVEKFENCPLVDWASEVPRIFHDEMNGYDFELRFVGTDADYQRVTDAFREQGIDEETVRIVRRGDFEGVRKKRKEIEDLIAWLRDNPNRKFDFDAFMDEARESLDATMPYIIVREEPVQLELPYVDVETVESAFELEGTDLTNTPILMVATRENRSRFREELIYVLGRADIDRRQLFFYIQPPMNRERATRVISDLGVADPKIVDRPDDARIIEYLESYPAIDCVRRAILTFEEALSTCDSVLNRVNTYGTAANDTVRSEIANIDFAIEEMRSARERIADATLPEVHGDFSGCVVQLMDEILSWRNRKTSVSGREQILKEAFNFEQDVTGWVSDVETKMGVALENCVSTLRSVLQNIYYVLDSMPLFQPEVAPPEPQGEIELPDLAVKLAKMYETTTVHRSDLLFSLFSSPTDQREEKVDVASYEKWREWVAYVVRPPVLKYSEALEDAYLKYAVQMVDGYERQLDELIEKRMRDRERATSRLSDSERMLQEDKNWLYEFDNRLDAIERN